MKDKFLLTIFTLYIFYNLLEIIPFRQKGVNMTFFDVGQGDSILLTTKNRKKILIDGGEFYDIDSQLMRYLSPFLCIFDIVFPTHVDADHIGGINRVLARCFVKRIYFNKVSCESGICRELYEKLDSLKVTGAYAGDTFVIDEVAIKILWPTKEYHERYSKETNEMSTILLFSYKDFDALFTGDAGSEVLNNLNIDQIRNAISGNLEIYKVPHHGSRNSIAPELVAALNPKYCVISAGLDNKFGHPHLEAVRLLESYGCTILRTDELGTIEFKIY